MTQSEYLNPALLELTRPLPKKVGIIGAGTIGPDIGYYLKSAIRDLTLVLIDINASALASAHDRVEKYAEKGLARGKLSPEQAADVKANILTSTDYDELVGCDWVIEAATENLDLKKKIFSDVEARVEKDCLITSNTSSIPAERLFSHLAHPERATVTHFFAPAFKNPAVEVIAWDGATKTTIDDLRVIFYRTDKVPLVTKDVVCFMLDRIFDNWCNEAALLLDPITPAEVDSVASEFVHAGPFFVLNLANGNPIIIETNTLQMEVEGAHYKPAACLETAGRWDTVNPGEEVAVSGEVRGTVRDRLLGVLFSQSFEILDRQIGRPEDLELGSRLAFAFKEGPLDLARSLGNAEVDRIVARFVADRPGMPQPTQPLTRYQEFYRTILVDEKDGVKIVTLRRPEALNALHDGMTDEILDALNGWRDDDAVRGVVITGYGPRAFSAGADIGRFPSMLGDKAASIEYARACSRLLIELDRYPKPVVAAINGMALGGGLELAMRCHALIGVHEAWLQFPEITLGIAPGIGAMVVPYRRWPKAADEFHAMLLTGAKLSAQRALDIGIFAELATADHLLERAVARVHAMIGNDYTRIDGDVAITPPSAPAAPHQSAAGQVLSTKVAAIMAQAITEAAAASTWDAALEIGYTAFGDSALTDAAREGIESFGARRPPDFQKTG